MSPVVQDCLIHLALTRWRELDLGFKPDALWILQYAPVPIGFGDDFVSLSLLPQFAWFADKTGVQSRSVEDWEKYNIQRKEFDTAKQEQFGHYLQLNGPFEDGEFDDITYLTGQAWFAAYTETDLFYLDSIYGPRHARVFRLQINASGHVLNEQLTWWS